MLQCIYIYIYIYISMYIYIHTHKYAYIYVCVCVHGNPRFAIILWLGTCVYAQLAHIPRTDWHTKEHLSCIPHAVITSFTQPTRIHAHAHAPQACMLTLVIDAATSHISTMAHHANSGIKYIFGDFQTNKASRPLAQEASPQTR